MHTHAKFTVVSPQNQPLRRLLVGLSAALAIGALGLAPLAAQAYDENSTAAINIDAKGVGLKGHDPVSYFTAKAPAKGNAQFSASHAGVTYHFASAANRDAFNADPARYAPQFGGFCAMGVALGKKLDADPAAWHVADGKLYVNLNADVQKKWLADVPGHNAKAEKAWPGIAGKSPKSL
jgi:YHS domain-containing protein